MVISSRSPEAVAAASLAARIERAVTRPAYLLVMHTDDFARMAWRHGRRAAQLLERKTSADLAEVARRLLLDEDAFVHASGSDVYVVALCDPEHAADDPLCDRRRHFRAVLERAFLDAACVEMISSWAALRAGADVPRAIEGAIAQGYRQRERRAYAELLHDLTTLVSGIRGSLATALDDSVDRRTVHRFLESALTESARLGRLLHNFLSAEQNLGRPAATDLAVALERAIGFVEPLAFEREMTIRLHSASARSAIDAQLDEDEATLLFAGLLENAIKYGRPGGIVEADIRVGTTTCEIAIDDDGPGVADADRERIFEFGQRAGSDVPGWGIGLSRARSLLEAHGGEICVERSPSGGARFTVRLPRARKDVQGDIAHSLVAFRGSRLDDHRC
jgi:signal transduction histidine kinase